jgi:putative NIF3 family GTP cyclohydrolase 1 type 2
MFMVGYQNSIPYWINQIIYSSCVMQTDRREREMINLSMLEKKLDELFQLDRFGSDPAFSRFIPMVYDPIGFDWRNVFHHKFTQQFNGLMLKGAEEVSNVFLAVFPTDDVLIKFLDQSQEGDLLFMHHPLFMECGDPRGAWGKGFVPIKEHFIDAVREKKLSIYTCHMPMDVNKKVGTSISIAEAFHATVVDSFFEECGLICEIPETNTEALICKSLQIFDIPYVDFEGRHLSKINRIAIVAGCGDKVSAMKEAEEKGAQAYITGEVHCHIDNDYGRQRYQQMMEYVNQTSMSLIGVSHAASEFLVKKTQMKNWLEKHFDIHCILLPQDKWWR